MAVTMLCACCCCYNNQTMLLDKAEAVYVWNCFVLNCSPQNGNARTPAERERERMMCVRQRWMEIVREEKHEKRVREIASERSAYIPVMVYGIHIHTREVHGKWSALHRRTKEIEESRSSIDDLVWDWYVVVLMLLLLQLLLLELYTNYSCNPLIPTSSIQIRKKNAHHYITALEWYTLACNSRCECIRKRCTTLCRVKRVVYCDAVKKGAQRQSERDLHVFRVTRTIDRWFK